MNHYITVEERNSMVSAHSTYADVIKTEHDQPLNLLHEINQIGQQGILGRLNQFKMSSNTTIIFTGQQPTADYGIHRRMAKREGVGAVPNRIMMHCHADHDRAGKNGFASFEVPVVYKDEEGVLCLDIKEYKYDIDFNESDFMHAVPPASLENTIEILAGVKEDVTTTLVNLGYELATVNASVEIYDELIGFLSQNYSLIRSQAELNGVIQTFIIKKTLPEVQTLDIMLSDLIHSDIFKEAMVSLLAEMPAWIESYDLALAHIKKTEYDQVASLPTPEQSFIDKQTGDKYHYIPVWFTKKNGNGRNKREKILMRQTIDGDIEYGLLEENQFVFLFNQQNILDNDIGDYKEKISPAAVTLVDILRNKLNLPIIHGKTGYYYEAVNEITRHHMNTGELPLVSMVVNPSKIDGVSPIASRHHTTRHPGYLTRVARATMDELSGNLDFLSESIEGIKQNKGLIFNNLLEIQSTFQIRETPIDGNIIEEIDTLKRAISETDTPVKKHHTKNVHQLRNVDLVELLFEASQTGILNEGFGQFPKLEHYWNEWKAVFDQKLKIAQADQELKLLGEQKLRIQDQISKINRFMDSDTPLIVAIGQRYSTLVAMSRLNRMYLKYES